VEAVRYLSVCSGIEAASVAWAPLGWKPLAFAEIEPFPRAVLAHHHPDVPLHGDFTLLRDQPWIADADLLVGGTPCQAFSIAGLRQSLADDRGNLSLEFIRLANAIDDLRRDAGRPPAYVLWENVPGVLSVGDNAFGAFLGGLVGSDTPIVPRGRNWTDAGVVAGPQRVAAWRILDAQHFGLAQRRRRVFVLAREHPGGWACADALLPILDGLSGHPAPRREAGKGTAGRAAHGAEVGGDGGIAHTLKGEGFDASEDGTGRGTPIVPAERLLHAPVISPALKARDFKGPSSDGDGDGAPLIAHAIQAGALRENPASGPDGVGVQEGLAYTVEARAEVQAVAYSLMPMNSGKDFKARAVDVSQPLMAGGPVGGDQGGDLILTPLAFDTTQITSAANFSAPKPGDPCHPLAAGAHAPAIAFTCKDHGADAAEDLAPTMRAMGHGETHANGGGQLAVAFALRGREGGAQAEIGGEVSNALLTPGGGASVPMMATASAVRRLTPTECERLQGFSDGYTDIPWRGKPSAPDGPRYKSLGNSMAVPCMAYIGQRIAEIEAAATDRKAAA